MTSNWLSISDAAAQMRLSDSQVRRMAVYGAIHARQDIDRWEVCAGAVAAWREQQRPSYGPVWEPWTAAEHPEDFRDRADYDDAPNDEGDEH